MQNARRADLSPNQVMALFAASALSFSLSNNATYADLANQLEHAGARHVGKPKAIYLRIGIAFAKDAPSDARYGSITY